MKKIEVKLVGKVEGKSLYWNMTLSYAGVSKSFKGVAVSRNDLKEIFELLCTLLRGEVEIDFLSNMKSLVDMFENHGCDKIKSYQSRLDTSLVADFEEQEKEGGVLLPYMIDFSENFKDKDIDSQRSEFFASLVMAYMHFFNKNEAAPEFPILKKAKQLGLVEKDFEIEDFLVELESVVSRA